MNLKDTVRQYWNTGDELEDSSLTPDSFVWEQKDLDVSSIGNEAFFKSLRRWIEWELKDPMQKWNAIDEELAAGVPILKPIILVHSEVFEKPEDIDRPAIMDGWHRLALAVKHNVKTIPAIVGFSK